MLKKDDIFIDWSSWPVVGPIVLPKLWFECGLSPHQNRTNDVRNVVLLALNPSSIHHYISGSDQFYHLVHIIVEFYLYGNLDKLLLSPLTTFSSSPWFVSSIQLVLETFKALPHVPFMRYMFGWKKWLPRIHVHLVQVVAVSSRKIGFVSSGTIPSQLCMCECILWIVD